MFYVYLFSFVSQEVFTRIKLAKLTAKHAVMVLLSPKKIVLVQVQLAARHAPMVRNVFLAQLLATVVFTRVFFKITLHKHLKMFGV